MKKFLAVILIAVSASSSLFGAKNTSDVKGRIIESKENTPVAYATVSIHRSDSTIVSGATTADDGSFEIANIPFGEYTLKVSFIGYKEYSTPLTINTPIIECGEIAIEEDAQMLASAVVTDKRPVIEQKLDKLIMNVADVISTQGSNAIEVLRKAPGISVDANGNITLNGSVVDVWIDGRPSYLSGKELEAMLLSTDGNTIDKIEIMAHPSAKYDAQGAGGIINIKTKKNFFKGFNGSVSGTYGGMMYDKYLQEANGTVNLAYRGDKTNTVFTYSPRYEENMVNFDTKTWFGDDNNMTQTSNTDYMSKNMSHSIKLSNDFFINKKNIFGFIVTSMLRNEDEYSVGDSYTNTFMDDAMIYSQKSDIDNVSTFDNIAANMNFTHTFNEQKGQEMTINADYAYYDLYTGSSQSNIYVDPITRASLPDPIIFTSDGRQYINMYSAKLDYQQAFWKTGSLEFGGKWAMTNTDNNTLRQDLINDQWKKNDDLSSKFIYNEQIAALYASVAKMFGQKWVAKAGLRGEYTYSQGNWISANDKTVKSYFNLFPTVYVGYTPSQNWRYTMSYTMRIRRPSFSQMNPQRLYVDANSSVQGNPNVDPQFTDQVSVGFGYKSFLNVSALYIHTRNLIMQNPILDDTTGDKILFWSNFGTQDMAGLNVSLTELPLFKWWILNASVFGAYNSNQNLENTYSTSGLLANAYANFTFLLPKEWKIEFGGFFQSPATVGYFRTKPMYMFFGGVKKNFFDNKATLTLNVSDIFRTFKSDLCVYDGDKLSYTINQDMNLQKVSVSFTYRFGKAKPTRHRNVGELEDASRVGGGASIGAGTSTK